MYSTWPRNATDVRVVCLKMAIASARGLMKLVLPPSPAKSLDSERRRPGVRENRVVDGVEHVARRHLAHDALAALADEQRILQEDVVLR